MTAATTQKTVRRPGSGASALLLLLAAVCLCSCSGFHLTPRQEIDTFSRIDEQPVETMEVQGIVYVKVVNPAAAKDESAPASIWIPLNIYRRGGYQPSKTPLLAKLEKQVRQEKAALAAARQPHAAGAAPSPGSAVPAPAPMPATAGVREEQLGTPAPAPAPPPAPLRRRALIFPSYITGRQPEIISQLSLELEEQLPLDLLPRKAVPPREDSWQTNDLSTLQQQIRQWLRERPGIPAVQFIITVTTLKGTLQPCYQVTFFEAQTATTVASFTFCRQGRPGQRFVPAHPRPLVRLLLTSPWWCFVRPGPGASKVYLTAGQKSGLTTGRRLQLCQPARRIIDPVKKISLGYAFGPPLGEAVVTEFFGQNGAVARLDKPLKKLPAGCLAIPAPPASTLAAPAIPAATASPVPTPVPVPVPVPATTPGPPPAR